jgi:hypothetical protein
VRTQLCTWLILLAWPTAAALAQTDDQTRDYEEQDRRYYERHIQKKKGNEEGTPQAAPRDRAAETAAFLDRADELIRDSNYRSFTGRHYRVQSDDPRVDVKAAVSLLDAFRDFFDGYWSDRLELVPYDEQSRAFLFYSFYKFNKLLVGDWRFNVNRPKGHYRPWFDVITIHTDPGGQTLAETLIHEAAHQLLEQRLFGGDEPTSIWLSEGMASYFGYMLLDGDMKFQPGVVGAKGIRLVRDGPSESAAEARSRLQDFRKELKSMAKDGVSPFDEVLSIRDPAVFYGKDSRRYYSASWLLVHFLLHGDDGAHSEAFLHWLSLEARGEGGAAALYRETGLAARELDAAMAAHVKRLRVH